MSENIIAASWRMCKNNEDKVGSSAIKHGLRTGEIYQQKQRFRQRHNLKNSFTDSYRTATMACLFRRTSAKAM